MPEKPLQIRLETSDQSQGQFTLSCGSSHYTVTLNPDVTLSEWLRRLRPVLTGHDDPGGDIDPQDLLRNVGMWLWKALLPDSAAAEEGKRLANLLRTEHTALLLDLPDVLAELPWELLCDPDQDGENGFLASRRPLIRLGASTTLVTPIEAPLRVLLLISSPPVLGEDSRIDVESERAAVEQAVHQMREAGFLHLMIEDIVTPKRVEQLLDRFNPHIIHYIGHGEYDQTSGGTLLWEDDQGNVLSLSAARIASLLRSRNLHAVVLHGCETARSNARAEIRSLAGHLVQEGLPTILAQQANLTYESSQVASRTWYQALVTGQNMAQAILAVRKTLIEADRPDWAAPVLQGGMASLSPLLDISSIPGVPDPLITRRGTAADMAPPTTIFVGRHRELRTLHLMLEDVSGNRPVLAIITGPGGMGKSTLVAQAVHRYGGAYKAALVLQCQEYQSMDLFLQSVGEFLKRLGAPLFLEQVLPDPQRSIEAKVNEAIVALNSAGPVLLVIDNLESVQNEDQLISDTALLSLLQKLIANLSGGRILITGRFMLKEPVLLKDAGARFLHLDLEDLSRYETGQLMLRHPPLARLSEVVRHMLIREFGGLPYVYHLLSSRAATQDLEQIIYEVRDYGTVKQKMITEERRQHTAEEWQKVHREVVEFAALEVIIYRLSEASRTLLTQLGVLQRPFPFAAIRDGLGAEQTAWQPLLDWSLLHYDPYGKNYQLHSLTRRYVEGLLDEHTRRQAQTRLATWYDHYADHTSYQLADYLEAYRLWRAAGHVQQAGQLVTQLAETLRRFGMYPLLRDLCVNTASDIHDGDELLVASALHELGNIAYLQGAYEQACDFYLQSLTIEEGLEDQHGRANSLYQLGMIAQDQGRYEQARDLYQQSLAIDEQLGNLSGQATVFHQLGMIAQSQGEYEQARDLYQQSLAIKDQLGDLSGRASTLHQLGMIAQDQGKYGQARDLYQQSLAIKDQLGDLSGQAKSLHQLGVLAQKQGRYEQARDLYQQSLAIEEGLGDQRGRAASLHALGKIAQDQGEYEQAHDFYQRSLAIFEQLGDQSGLAGVLHQLGMIAQDQGEYEQAHDFYQQSLAIFEHLGDQSGLASSLGQLGSIAYAQGDYKEARRLYLQSLRVFSQLENQSERATTLHLLGRIAQKQGKYEQARTLYQQSLAIFEHLGDQSGQGKILYQLGTLTQDQGDYEQARDFYQRSLAIFRQSGDQSALAGTLHQLGMLAQNQGEYEQARDFYQRGLAIFRQSGDQSALAGTLHQLGMLAQDQGEYEEARSLYQQSLVIKERLKNRSGQASSLGQLGLLAYEQKNFENALAYTIQAYILFDTLQSPFRDLAQRTIAQIRNHLDEETFLTHWRTLTGDRPPAVIEAQEDPLDLDDDDTLTIEELPAIVSSIILHGTTEQREQMIADLLEAQQQLSPEDTPLKHFSACLVATLQRETPEVIVLEPPFTELWQEFEALLRVPSDKSSQQEEKLHE